MRVFSLDASSTTIGWCYCDVDQDRLIILETGLIEMQEDIVQRCTQAYIELQKIVTHFDIDCVIFEAPVLRNKKSFMPQLRVSGIILLMCGQLDKYVQVLEVAPTSAKLALTGSGKAEKEDMIRFAENYTNQYLSEHEADAIGIALAYKKGKLLNPRKKTRKAA